MYSHALLIPSIFGNAQWAYCQGCYFLGVETRTSQQVNESGGGGVDGPARIRDARIICTLHTTLLRKSLTGSRKEQRHKNVRGHGGCASEVHLAQPTDCLSASLPSPRTEEREP